MKMQKIILSVCISAALIVCLLPSLSYGANDQLSIGTASIAKAQAVAHSQAEAVAWANQKYNERWGVDVDGNGLWCTDLIFAYYDHLGVSRSYGHAYAYKYNGLPSGWTRDSTPRPGDIVVIDAYGRYNTAGYRTGEFGHVGIVTEVRSSTFVYIATAQNQTAYPEECYTSYAACFIHPDFPSSDTQAPSITDVQVYDVSASGYWVSCRISDNVGVARISFPTWTVKGGQDDLLWRDNTSWDGTTARFHVKVGDHGNQRGCNYITHIYAWDAAGNVKSVGAPTTFVPSAEGYLDAAVGGDGTVKVKGWAFDWASSSSSINVDIYAGGPAGSGVFCGRLKANNKRADVNKARGISGNHGFEGTVKVGKRGNVKIYAYALAIKGSGNPQLSPVKTSTVLDSKGSATSVLETTYAIRTKMDASKGLDVDRISQKNTANVMLCGWNGGENQKFAVKSAGDGSYYIIANHSNKAVEVTNGLVTNGANVAQYAQNKSVAQRWFFDKNKDGTYTIRQRQSGLVMDVYGKFTADGTNIMQGTPNGGDNQKFYLVPIDASRWSVSVADQVRTGKALKPVPSVKAGGVAMKAGSDFTVSYKNNKAVGTASVTVKGKGAYTGSKTVTFRIGSASLSGASISGVKARTYTGAKQTQTPTVKLGKKTLKKGTDYTLSYSGNVNAGKATVKVAGKGNYVGTKSATFTIAKAGISGATVAAVKAQKHTGKAVKPNPKVTFKGKTLKNGTDYTLSYKNNVKRGKATIVVTGKGNFKGTKSLTFKIT